ncbi:substrate-binding domain-containing protein [Winogradskyella sp. A3E31]|uniref:substrate-binding domain-containing protein n=1 Tax=Winogradskyella sp. A3E31 TaxID=3349637 RepID=UPI00398A6CE1
MKKVKIGGVPEHFNLPWYFALKNGDFKSEGINLRWEDYHGGTGEMCKALRNDDIDLAVILTEGIIKDIIADNPSKIVQTYVKTPLIWGIHVADGSGFETLEDIKGKRAAISRYGSGSHLMAYVNAKNQEWNLEKDLKFEVIKNLEGAVNGLTNGDADYFMWEKFTTKPLVDTNVFRRIGNCPSPWPCFVIAATDRFIKENPEDLSAILKIINKYTEEFKDVQEVDQIIAKRYHQQLEDVQEWLSITEWSQTLIPERTISNVQNELFDLNIIPEKWPYQQIVKQL